jgi:hypothetical protein
MEPYFDQERATALGSESLSKEELLGFAILLLLRHSCPHSKHSLSLANHHCADNLIYFLLWKLLSKVFEN